MDAISEKSDLVRSVLQSLYNNYCSAIFSAELNQENIDTSSWLHPSIRPVLISGIFICFSEQSISPPKQSILTFFGHWMNSGRINHAQWMGMDRCGHTEWQHLLYIRKAYSTSTLLLCCVIMLQQWQVADSSNSTRTLRGGIASNKSFEMWPTSRVYFMEVGCRQKLWINLWTIFLRKVFSVIP